METNEDIIIFNDDNLSIEVRVDLERDTVWLTQDQMVKLFKTDKSRISRHIRNILSDGELQEKLTAAENASVQLEGDRKVKRTIKSYNLDMIISVG